MAPKKLGKKKHGKGKAGGLLHIGKAKGKKDAGKKKKGGKGKAKAQKGKSENKFASGFKNLLKSKGAALEAKMKKKGLEMKEKMKSKGNELRKRMKEKVKEKSIEVKKKMKETSVEMKKKMREKGHEFKEKMKEGGKDMKTKMKAKGKELKADMRKKLKETEEQIKHAGQGWEGWDKESTADVTSKLVTWRQTFEDKGWAVGKVYNDWATLMLMGLNGFSALLAFIVFGVSVSMASRFRRECLTLLLSPAVAVGFLFSILLLLVSAAGFVGVWFNRLDIVKMHFFATGILVFFLFSFTIDGFTVTSRGGGTKLPKGISFKKYNLTDYSKWLQHKVNDAKNWPQIRSCISSGSFCKNWTVSTPEQLYTAKFSSTQLGCCAPPFACGFSFQGGVVWKLPAFPEVDTDCTVWSDRNWQTSELCYDCNSCKAGLLQNVKSIWYKASIVNIVVIAALGAIMYRTWFVMRVAGRWDSIAVTVKKAVKPKKEGKEEEQSVIDIGEDVHEDEHPDEEKHEEDDDTLIPAWLEKDIPADEIPKSSAGSEDSASTTSKKKSKRQKGKGQASSATASEASSESTTSKKSHKRGKAARQKGKQVESEQGQEDDAWASPRQQADQSTGSFPQGFLAQNPLTTMSPWLQSPEAGYMQDGSQLMQAYLQGQAPADYMQAYYGYDPNVQGFQTYMQQDPSYQSYLQDPMQMMYDQQQQMYMQQDPQMQQQQMYLQQDPSQAYSYMQDPNQAYMQQDPSQGYNFQAYMQDPNQAAYMQDPNQAAYMQDPNQAAYLQEQNQAAYMQDPYGQAYNQGWQNHPY